MRLVPILLMSVLLVPAAAQAQSAPAPGERVYVRHEGQRIEGSLVTLGQDSLVIATARGPAMVAPPPRLIYRHAGHTSRGKGILMGAGIGGLVGAVVGGALGYSAASDDPSGFLSDDVVAAYGAIAFGGTGILVGGLIGLSFTGDKWEAVQIRPTIGLGRPADDDAFLVGFEARFQARF